MRFNRWYFVFILGALLPRLAGADGVVVTPPNDYASESSQTAVLFYEASTQQETMVVQTTYRSTAKDFAWLIPTPNEPAISRGSKSVLSTLADVTTTRYTSDYEYSVDAKNAQESNTTNANVTVVSEQLVDYYDAVVLEASNATELVQWLNDHGYAFPEKYQYILSDYLQNGWYFTALRINQSALENFDPTTTTQTFTPVQLTFTAPHLVYPLRISGVTTSSSATVAPSVVLEDDRGNLDTINSDYITPAYPQDSTQPITLYVIDDHKVTANHFSTVYADAVTQATIESWGVDANGNPWVEPKKHKYYLTKLSASFTPTEMTEDVFFSDAENNNSVGTGPTWRWDGEDWGQFFLFAILATSVTFALSLLSPFGISYVVATWVRARAQGRGWRIVAIIAQWFISMTVFLIYTLFWVMNWSEVVRAFKPSYYTYKSDSIGVIIGFFLTTVGVLTVMFFINLLTGKIAGRHHGIRS